METLSADISNADLRALMSGDTPKPKQPEPTSETVEETAKTPEAAKEPAEPKPEPKEEHAALPAAVQKRIDKEIAKAVSARKEAEEILAKAKAEAGKSGTEPAQTTAPPKAEGRPVKPKYGDGKRPDENWEQYETVTLPAYEDELLAWSRQQTLSEFERVTTEKQRKVETDKVWEKARKDFPTFDEARVSLIKQTSEPFQIAMSQFENWPAMAVHMDDNPESLDATKKQFEANQTMGIVALAKLSESLKPTPKARASADPLPEPPDKVGGEASLGSGKSLQEKLATASMPEFKKLMQKHA